MYHDGRIVALPQIASPGIENVCYVWTHDAQGWHMRPVPRYDPRPDVADYAAPWTRSPCESWNDQQLATAVEEKLNARN